MSGQKLMNAKEMPVLKNSKDNYQHTLSKTSFSACFNSAERLVNMYYWNKATGIRAHVLIADCYGAREMLLLTIVWDPNWDWIRPSVLQEESAVTLEDWAEQGVVAMTSVALKGLNVADTHNAKV